jgi:hypothetical protein
MEFKKERNFRKSHITAYYQKDDPVFSHSEITELSVSMCRHVARHYFANIEKSSTSTRELYALNTGVEEHCFVRSSPDFIPKSAPHITHISFKERDSVKWVMKE